MKVVRWLSGSGMATVAALGHSPMFVIAAIAMCAVVAVALVLVTAAVFFKTPRKGLCAVLHAWGKARRR